MAAALTAGCAAEPEGDTGLDEVIDNFTVAWNPSSCILARARRPRLRICVRGSGDLANGQRMTRRSLEAWLRPLRERYDGVATDIEFGCDAPDGTVNVYRGSGRAHAGPGVVLGVYDQSSIGSWIHEFGHAFACLGDTYVGGTAGRCAPGQPRSVMCYGLLLNDVTADDIAGLYHQADRLRFPRRATDDGGVAPDVSTPPPPTPPPPTPPPPTPAPPPPAGRCAATACGTCTPLAGCGWCGATGRCVEVDRSGQPLGACAAGFALSPPDCPDARGVVACGRYASWSVWTCTGSRTRVRCVGGSLQRESCATRCVTRPTGVDDVCE